MNGDLQIRRQEAGMAYVTI